MKDTTTLFTEEYSVFKEDRSAFPKSHVKDINFDHDGGGALGAVGHKIIYKVGGDG